MHLSEPEELSRRTMILIHVVLKLVKNIRKVKHVFMLEVKINLYLVSQKGTKEKLMYYCWF